MKRGKISLSGLDLAILKVRSLAHRLRMGILGGIDAGTITCPDHIEEAFHLEQSDASRHTRILVEAGMITKHKEGKHTTFALNYDEIAKTNNAIKKLIG